MKTAVIINPTAGSGKMRRAWPKIEPVLAANFPGFTRFDTAGNGDAANYARQAAADGAGLIVAVGGNGTFNEVADGLLHAGRSGADAPELGFVPVGIGMDLARSLGLPLNAVQAARALVKPARRVDAGRITYSKSAEVMTTRHFANIASLGLSGPIVEAVNNAKGVRWLAGPALFFLRTIQALIGYKFRSVRVTVEGHAPVEASIAVVAVANGRFFGGGMAIAPDAEHDDGLFDVVILRAASKMFIVDQFSRIYNGGHRNLPEVTILRGPRVHVEESRGNAAGPTLIEADGENCGMLPATFEIIPGALNIRC